MLSTLWIIGGVIVGLLVLLVIIVGLSGRGRTPRSTSTEIRAVR